VLCGALATLDLIETRVRGECGRRGRVLHRAPAPPPVAASEIGDVRGRGLFIGLELVRDRASKVPAKELCDAAITRAFHNGVLLLSCGASTIRFAPPLVVTRAEVDEVVAIVDASLTEARKTSPAAADSRGGITMKRFFALSVWRSHRGSRRRSRPALHRLHQRIHCQQGRKPRRPSKSLPSPEKARQYHRFLTAEPHPPGRAEPRTRAVRR